MIHFFKTVLAFYVSFTLAMNAHSERPEQARPTLHQEEMLQLVVKDLKDILLDIDSDGFFDFKNKCHDMGILKYTGANSNKFRSFFEKPIIISNLSAEEINRTAAAIQQMFKYLQRVKENKMQKNPTRKFTIISEYYLFERMNKVFGLMNCLREDVEIIRKQKDAFSRQQAIESAKERCIQLYRSLLLLRCSSFLEYIRSSETEYDSEIKTELTDNIYSIAVTVLRLFRDVYRN